MKKTFLYIIFFISFFKLFANDSIKTSFTKLNISEKVTFFKSLNEIQKKEYHDYFFLFFTNAKSKTKKNDELKNIEYCIGLLYQLKDKHLDAITTFKLLSENNSFNLTDSERMDIYLAMQESYLKLNLYSKVFDINKKINLLIINGVEYPLWSYNIQSRLYLQLHEYDKAIIQLQKEIKTLYKNPKRDSLIIPSAFNDLGYYHYLKGDYSKALDFYDKAITVAKKSLFKYDPENYTNIYFVIKGNIIEAKLKIGQFSEVIYLITTEILHKIPNNNTQTLFDAKLLLAQAYLGTNDLSNFNATISELEKNCCFSNTALKRSFLITKIKYYEKIKDDSNAYVHFKELKRIDDSLNFEQKKKNYLITELNYFIDEKEKEVRQINEVIEEKEKTILIITIIGLFIFLIISVYFIKSMRKKRIKIEQMNASILQKNNTIKTSLKEKKLLLKEIHHRVKNNLQIISGILELQNSFIDDIGVKTILNEGQNRIQAIALLHKTMYQNENFNAIDFEIYLNELITHIKRTNSNPEKNIAINIVTNDVKLDIDTAIPISLIINEALSNCYKHAYPNKNNGQIVIEFKKETDNNYILKITDDGIGMPNTININSSNTIGLDLIKGLTSQLNGTASILNDKGTQLIISYTVENDKF